MVKMPNEVEIVCKLSLLTRVGKNDLPSRIGGTERGHCLSSKFVAMVKAATERLLCISKGNGNFEGFTCPCIVNCKKDRNILSYP